MLSDHPPTIRLASSFQPPRSYAAAGPVLGARETSEYAFPAEDMPARILRSQAFISRRGAWRSNLPTL